MRRDLGGNRLAADVISAVREMRLDAHMDRDGIAPGDDRVHDCVAALACQIGVAPADAPEVVRVAVQREIALHLRARGGSRDLWILRKDDGLLDREERPATELLSSH